MRTLDLRQDTVTLRQVLEWAASESVLLQDENGREFIVGDAEEFDREVAELSASDKFMRFLDQRSAESGGVPLEEIERRLAEKGE